MHIDQTNRTGRIIDISDIEHQFITAMEKLEKDPDKRRLLAVCALLNYDDENEYTIADYQNAAVILDAVLLKIGGDTEDCFIEKGKQWLVDHLIRMEMEGASNDG